jgi:D-amino-acid dehydrogenase
MRVLDRQALIDLEPTLADAPDDFIGGTYSEIDEAGNSHAFARGLVEVCSRSPDFRLRLGARVETIGRESNRVTGIATDAGTFAADAWVLALGAESGLVAKTLNLDIPVYPLKGYSVTVPIAASAPSISVTDTRNRMVFCGLGDHLRIAGIAELVGYDDSVDHRRIDQLLGLARLRFPRAGEYREIIDRWQGWRPMTPSSLPVIGRAAGYHNLFLNTGHGMFGWTLACGSAELLARQIDGEPIPPSLAAVLTGASPG